MPSPYLTKSDFKACLDCRTKLFYRKQAYPSNLDDDEYLRFLADGGFMVEFIAKAQFPAGIDLVAERDPIIAAERTAALLATDGITIFEAAVIAGKYHVRVDVLRRQGSTLHLIEIKSSSLGEDDDSISPFLTKKGTVESRSREYVMDVAFQTLVLQRAFPQFQVAPQLCVVDKRNPVTGAETLDRFILEKDGADPKSRPKVIYRGNVADLAKSRLVCFRAVEREVNLVMPEVVRKAEALGALVAASGTSRFQEDIAGIYRQCRVCEYRVANEMKNGFRECWGKLADAEPHILDLYRVGQIASSKTPDPVPALLGRGCATLLGLGVGDLGTEGVLQQRRRMQWEAMRAGGAEHLPAVLREELKGHQRDPGWPLHFVDFEACEIALPHHAGLRPYERVAFQWSCHTLLPDGAITHAEWLNTAKEFPNFAFAKALREQLGDQGTVYVWSSYEQTSLKNVTEQIAEWLVRDPAEAVRLAGVPDAPALNDLAVWIDRLLGPEDKAGKRRSPRIRDLHELARLHYFHPRMRGRTSIKVVLPAVWESDARLWCHPEFERYVRRDDAGQMMDPYKVLPAFPLGDDEHTEEAVREGTGAIRAYQDLMFGTDRSAERLDARRKLLLQYCRLDTAAMVMIWIHWAG